jgi:biopolymer transport protein ExbD
MKISRQKKSRKGRIEIIPMIDVMFFLLVTFMIASLSMQRINGVPVNLTKGQAEKITVENRINISITHDNKIYLDKIETTPEALEDLLRNELAKNEDKTVIVFADEHAFQGVVTGAMLSAKKAGAKRFSIVAQEK